MNPYIYGIDPSWNSFGIIGGKFNRDILVFSVTLKLNRYNKKTVMSAFTTYIGIPADGSICLYMIEDYNRGGAYQNPNSLIAMAELRGILELFLEDVKNHIIYVAPTQLKKFITGSGKGDKSKIMKDVYKRWNFDSQTSDEADAFGLWKIGNYLLDKDKWQELIKPQVEVLDKIYKKYRLVLDSFGKE